MTAVSFPWDSIHRFGSDAASPKHCVRTETEFCRRLQLSLRLKLWLQPLRPLLLPRMLPAVTAVPALGALAAVLAADGARVTDPTRLSRSPLLRHPAEPLRRQVKRTRTAIKPARHTLSAASPTKTAVPAASKPNGRAAASVASVGGGGPSGEGREGGSGNGAGSSGGGLGGELGGGGAVV